MTDRIVSVSAAAYDGHAPDAMLDSLARCGATHVEPAFIVGYTDPFDESAFSEANAARYASWLGAAGLGCHAVSSHIDLGTDGAVAVFRRRMDFAARLGAAVVNTNAAIRGNETGFFRNIDPLARHAASVGLVIGLENPGDGRPSLLDLASDGVALIDRIGSPWVRLNADPGNTASHRPDADAVADAVASLPACIHLHLKSVRRDAGGWTYPTFGEGDLDLGPLLDALGAWPELAVSLEMPIRMRRGSDAQPWRRVSPWPIADVERCVRASLAAFRRHPAR